MKRTFNPIMEVIRFTTEDVIVTSGTGGLSGVTSGSGHPDFIENHGYFAQSDDFKRARAGKPGNYPYVKFISNSGGENLVFTSYSVARSLDEISQGFYYTWFEDKWYTDNKTSDEYPFLTN